MFYTRNQEHPHPPTSPRPPQPSALRRWLQDTSKRKLADFLIFLRPPLPVSPGSPETDPMIDQNRRSG